MGEVGRHRGRGRPAAWVAGTVALYAALAVVAYMIGPSASSKARCAIFGSGSGRTAGGDRFNFSIFVAQQKAPRGLVAFSTYGPETPSWTLSHVHLSSITCSTRATTGNIVASAAVGAFTPHQVKVRMDLEVATTSRTHPTIRLQLTDGYDSGVVPLATGGITVQSGTQSRKAAVKSPTIPR